MGHQGQDTKRALISMTNGDVYTVGGTAASLLQEFIEDTELPRFIVVTDVKSGREIWVSPTHISSVVSMEAVDGGY